MLSNRQSDDDFIIYFHRLKFYNNIKDWISNASARFSYALPSCANDNVPYIHVFIYAYRVSNDGRYDGSSQDHMLWKIAR